MDLSSRSNTNYVVNNNNGMNNFGILNNNNINTNNSSTQLNNSANIKTLLSSPITGGFNQLRVVHHQQPHSPSPQQQNKRSSTAMLFAGSSVMTPSAFITPTPVPSVSHVPSVSSFVNNNNNGSNIINSSSSNSSNYYSSGGDDYRYVQNSISVASVSSNSGIGNGNNERIPCMLTDDDRLPHNAQILANRYLMLNQIAGSSFYECVDIRTGEALTCKAIGNCYSKILSAYFRMDGDRHIKPLHKLLQASDQTYLLLPPSQYGDLHSYVRERRRLREPEARHLFRQICKTVKSCHQQGIVLRDLKLRKFIFSDCDRTQLKFESLEDAVVLEDPDDDILKEKIGCPAYVAPEILKPNSDFSGKAADLWSLGVILYTMLVGRYPFNDPEHASLFAKIARCQFTIPEYLSSKARCLIKSLLQKVPKHRLTSEDVLYHPWLQEDNINNSPTINNSSFNCFNSNTNTINNDLSNDDQRVPEIDCLELT